MENYWKLMIYFPAPPRVKNWVSVAGQFTKGLDAPSSNAKFEIAETSTTGLKEGLMIIKNLNHSKRHTAEKVEFSTSTVMYNVVRFPSSLCGVDSPSALSLRNV